MRRRREGEGGGGAEEGEGRQQPHLSHHAVPRSVDLLPVFAVGHQVQVVGEFHRLGDLLQDVNAETLAAALDVDTRVLSLVTAGGEEEDKKKEG